MKSFVTLLLIFLMMHRPELTRGQQPVKMECGTDQYLQEQAKYSPALAAMAAERVSRNRTASENLQLRSQQQTVKVIPVVVHVMHDYSTSTNISKAKILDGMRMLNEDFNKLNPDTALVVPPFKQRVANVQVEFRLATTDPNGNCTEGITRTYYPQTQNATDNVKSLVKWDTNKYLNIWVAGNLANGAGAYATFPCGNPAYDGIVTRADRMGFTYSHTVSHEAGHYLGLDHTWGQGPVGQAGSCANDDGIADTPNTIGGSTPVCNLNQIHCGNLVNIQNIMDYGGCLIMFTNGQKAAMQNALNLPCRTNLWSPANLAATGTNGIPALTCAPITDFNANQKSICAGESIQFTDLSYNAAPDPTWTWAWTFTGGSPAVSTAQHPLVTYLNPGVYPVTLQAGNSTGNNSISRSSYIVVKATTGILQAPFTESFERSIFPEAPDPVLNWDIQNGTHTWHRTNIASADSTNSLRIRHQLIPANQQHALITPNINLAGVAQPALQFAVAYALRASNPSAADELRVFTSDDCGKNWILRYNKTGSALATTATPTNSFIPAANEWRTETIALPISVPHQLVKFESTSGNGTTLYLDAVRVVDGSVTGLSVDVPLRGFTVFPNPAQGNGSIKYTLRQAQQVEITLQNSLGQTVKTLLSQPQLAGEHSLTVDTSTLPAGMYFCTLQTAGSKLVQRWVLTQ